MTFISILGRWAARSALSIALGVWAGVAVADYRAHPEAQLFIQELAQEGFDQRQLESVFAQAERKQSILDAISRPAEKVRPWKEYRPLFISDSRIAQGVDFWRKHQAELDKAYAEYGVPPEVITAIIGVETFYGTNTGRFRVIDALSTLAFDYPPRAPFFRQQLREFLMLVREQRLDPLTLKGSYAGAMGWPQFMPGSYRAYAVDFDQDGLIDIWQNPADAIGSVASYFKHHGWQKDQPVVVRASVSGERFAEGYTQGIEPTKTLAELQALGWQPRKAIAEENVTAFRLEAKEGEQYWLGLKNFYAITRYNRSFMYAMAVHQLSQEIRHAKGTSQ